MGHLFDDLLTSVEDEKVKDESYDTRKTTDKKGPSNRFDNPLHTTYLPRSIHSPEFFEFFFFCSEPLEKVGWRRDFSETGTLTYLLPVSSTQ